MIEKVLLCLLKIIFSIAWVVTGRHLAGCPCFALSTSFLRWHHCGNYGNPSLEVMSDGHYYMIDSDSVMFREKDR